MPEWSKRGLGDLVETRDEVSDNADLLEEEGERVLDVLDRIRALVGELEAASALGPQPQATANAVAWNAFLGALRGIRVAVLAARGHGRLEPGVLVQLSTARRELEPAIGRFLSGYRQEVASKLPRGDTRDEILRALDRATEAIAARALVAEARGARDEVRRVLDDTQRAAGVVGETVLATHFASYAQAQRRIANLLRAASIAALLAITAIAAVLLFGGVSDNLTTAEELARLTVALPLAALAAYLGRESSHHRAASQWASELELQLLTIDAYCEPLADETRMQLRTDFGRRVFLTTGAVPGEHIEMSPSVASDVTGLLQRAITSLRASNSQ